MIKLKRIKPLDGYKLECEFENGEVVIYDMGYIKNENGSMIKPLKDESFFKNVFLEAGSPAWKNGYDVCADAIWKKTHRI